MLRVIEGVSKMSNETQRREPHRDAVEIEDVARRFESCAIPPDEFNHLAHLTVALWYLSQLSVPEAHARMRTNLQRYLAHHGHDQGRYHETITLFWIKLIRGLLERRAEALTLAEAAAEVYASCGDPQLISAYYSKELLSSPEARTAWAEPDLKALDF